MKVAVYLAVTNRYDTVRPPRQRVAGWDYLAFTDGTVNAPGFAPHAMTFDHDNPRLRAKHYKLRPHRVPELAAYDASVYVDGHLELIGDLEALVETGLATANLAAVSRAACSIYDEAKTVVRVGKAPADAVAAQMQRYRAEGCPDNIGFFQGGLLIRRHTAPDVAAFGDLWWDEVVTAGHGRDQLSHMYAVWKTNLAWHPLGPFGLTRNTNPHVKWRKHTKGRR